MKGGVNDETTGSWTAATRRQLERRLPWENLLPDRQPFYVGSWVYVFGVVTIAALDDRRGHLRHQHRRRLHRLPRPAELRGPMDRDERQGRDQRDGRRWILQRPELRPDVRPTRHAAAHRDHRPGLPAYRPGADERRGAADRACARVPGHVESPQMISQRAGQTAEQGVRTVRYDLLKELAIAMIVSLILILGLSVLLSSPDVPSVTIQSWAQADPVDLVTTANDELAGQSATALYGPPYNHGTDAVQSIGPISPQTWGGVHGRVDPPNDFVINPLKQAASNDAQLSADISAWQAASADQQSKWHDAYATALKDAKVTDGKVTVADGDYGPVPNMMGHLLSLAQTGALDGLLLSSDHFYQTDYSKPLLFMNDGGYVPALADGQHLTGDQWGMMNETGLYPGQTWLWLYTLWYQIPPFNQVSYTDLLVVLMMVLLTTLLLLVPFIPGLRDIPRLVPIYRLIWRG